MEAVDDGGASRERPVLAPGAAGVRSTRIVNFHTGKELHDAQRCHLNAAVFDFGWEREAGELLDSHSAVAAWVKNDRLGLVIPYREAGTPRKYLPDFIVELKNGEHLIVEIKGQMGNAAIKKAAAERWCRAVNNDGRYGNWAYSLCYGVPELKGVLGTIGHNA
jgi:type III restriction enzyme